MVARAGGKSQTARRVNYNHTTMNGFSAFSCLSVFGSKAKTYCMGIITSTKKQLLYGCSCAFCALLLDILKKAKAELE